MPDDGALMSSHNAWIKKKKSIWQQKMFIAGICAFWRTPSSGDAQRRKAPVV